MPLRPLRGLQETRVGTREESGVLGFPSRRRESHVSQAWTFLGAAAGALKLCARYDVLAKMLTALSLGPVIVSLHSKNGVFTNVIIYFKH